MTVNRIIPIVFEFCSVCVRFVIPAEAGISSKLKPEKYKTGRLPSSRRTVRNKPQADFLNGKQKVLFISGIFLMSFMLSSCSGMEGGQGLEVCHYYRQALQGGSSEFIGTQNKNIQSVQKQISEQCVPRGQIQLNINQCRTRLLENFGRKYNCV